MQFRIEALVQARDTTDAEPRKLAQELAAHHLDTLQQGGTVGVLRRGGDRAVQVVDNVEQVHEDLALLALHFDRHLALQPHSSLFKLDCRSLVPAQRDVERGVPVLELL